jgi:hypothetical protein
MTGGRKPAYCYRTPKMQNAPRGGVLHFGGLGRNRTTDTRIFNPLLYRLSYQAGNRFFALWDPSGIGAG